MGLYLSEAQIADALADHYNGIYVCTANGDCIDAEIYGDETQLDIVSLKDVLDAVVWSLADSVPH